MPDEDVWEELRVARERLRAEIEKSQHDRRRLCCVECGRLDPGDERGWTLRLDEDDELAAFCPECDRRE